MSVAFFLSALLSFSSLFPTAFGKNVDPFAQQWLVTTDITMRSVDAREILYDPLGTGGTSLYFQDGSSRKFAEIRVDAPYCRIEFNLNALEKDEGDSSAKQNASVTLLASGVKLSCDHRRTAGECKLKSESGASVATTLTCFNPARRPITQDQFNSVFRGILEAVQETSESHVVDSAGVCRDDASVTASTPIEVATSNVGLDASKKEALAQGVTAAQKIQTLEKPARDKANDDLDVFLSGSPGSKQPNAEWQVKRTGTRAILQHTREGKIETIGLRAPGIFDRNARGDQIVSRKDCDWTDSSYVRTMMEDDIERVQHGKEPLCMVKFNPKESVVEHGAMDGCLDPDTLSQKEIDAILSARAKDKRGMMWDKAKHQYIDVNREDLTFCHPPCDEGQKWNKETQRCEVPPKVAAAPSIVTLTEKAPEPAPSPIEVSPQPCSSGQFLIDGKCRDPVHDLKPLQTKKYKRPDPNKAPRPELVPIAKKLRKEFDLTQSCPKGSEDISVLKKLSVAMKSKGFSLDMRALIFKPDHPDKVGITKELPLLCGFSDITKHSYAVNAYCTNSEVCFVQGNANLSRNCDQYVRSKAETSNKSYPVFVLSSDCTGDASYRNGGTDGDMVFIPLGEGIFLTVTQTNRGEFFHGLLYTPTAKISTPIDPRLKKDQKTLKTWKKFLASQEFRKLSPSEQKRLKKMVNLGEANLASP